MDRRAFSIHLIYHRYCPRHCFSARLPALSLAVISFLAGYSLAYATSDRMTVNTRQYYVQNGGAPWAVQREPPDTLRFEVRSGDNWSGEVNKERSEIAGVDAFRDRVSINFDFSVEADSSRNTASWLCIGQWRQSQKAIDGSPPFALELAGEEFRVVMRQKPSEYRRLFADRKFQRDRWYHIKIDAKFDPLDGVLEVFRDNVQIVKYRGALGYFPEPEGGYWKSGIYRASASESFVLRVRGHKVF